MSKSESFTDITEDFLKEIVYEVRSNPNVDVKTKVDVLKEMTRWAQVKNKIAPEGAEGSKIDEYRNALKAGNSGDTKRGGNSGTRARAKIDKLEAKQNVQKVPDGKGFRSVSASVEDASRISGNGFGSVNPPRAFPELDRSDNDSSIVSVASKLGKSGTYGGI